MNKRSARRLGALAVVLMATLTGCGGTEAPAEAADVGEAEQGLARCNLSTGLYCSTGYTCVSGVCRPRCDTTNYVCSGSNQCCPGYFDETTGVGSAPYCATICMG